MNRSSVLLVCSLLALSTSLSDARDEAPIAFRHEADGVAGSNSPLKGGLSSPTLSRADTLRFGNVDADGFAILGDIWSFDHGGSDPLEGWYATDVTSQSTAYWRHITAASWDQDPEHTVDAPVLAGAGSAWVGATGTEANELCWESGLGYGNSWCQRLVSPTLTHDGVSDVDVSWIHFNDTEDDFDYVIAYMEPVGGGLRTELVRYDDTIGLAPDHPASPPVGVADNVTIDAADFDGTTSYQIVFEMTSDGGWSDSDGLNATEYGPAAFDDVSVDGNFYGFESDLEGWTAETCAGVGPFFGIAAVSDYVIEDYCDCDLEGNVLKFHDEEREQPTGMRVEARSAPVNLLEDANIPGSGLLSIAVDWTQYSVLPQANGVFYRPGWDYFPVFCEGSEIPGWSGRVGQNSFFFVGEDPICARSRNVGTEADVPIPSDAEQVRFIYEIYSSCDAFAIILDNCSGISNFTPLLDNIQIAVSKQPNAPQARIDALNGGYKDGYGPGFYGPDPTVPGNADVAKNINLGDTPPLILGDSLYVQGPLPDGPETQWESKLWFRVPRVGPSADSRYTNWRDRVADGRQIEGVDGDFTFAFMDSFRVGTNTANNKFLSYFREDDDDFDAGAGQLTEENEIIADGVLFPGTQVEYFVSSNYIGSPESYLYPDTAGGFALEFEILPSWRDDGGILKYPCVLVVNAGDDDSGYFLGQALDGLGVEYDRFDHKEGGCCGTAPWARGSSPLSNNGINLLSILGYQGVILSAGDKEFFSRPVENQLLSDYLTAECGFPRRWLFVNGSAAPSHLAVNGASLLTQLGATSIDSDYANYTGDFGYCVRLEAPSGGGHLFGTENSVEDYSYDAWGNWCPQQFSFDVMGVTGSGVGNRVYVETDDLVTETPFAQVVNIRSSVDGQSYTVIDGVAYHQTAEVDPVEECTSSEAAIVSAISNELRAAMEWAIGGTNLPGLCDYPCIIEVGVPEGGSGPEASVALERPFPNPFNPRTTLRFHMPTEGPVKLDVFDASGRRVRTLFDAEAEAGAHQVHWDGRFDSGVEATSGVYWAKLTANGYTSSARLIRIQ